MFERKVSKITEASQPVDQDVFLWYLIDGETVDPRENLLLTVLTALRVKGTLE